MNGIEDGRGLGIRQVRAGSDRRAGTWRWVLATGLAIILVAGHPAALLAQDTGQSEASSAGKIPQQVLIEIVIVEVQTDRASEVGVDWVYARGSRGRERGSAVREVSLRTLRFSRDNVVTFPTPDTGPTAGTTIRPGTTALGVPHPLAGLTLEGDLIMGDHATVFATLRALVDKGDAQIVSRPIVVVQSGRKAEIHVGGEIPYQALTFDNRGNPVLTVAFEKVGVDLVVTPQILQGDIVRLNLDPVRVSSLTRTENIRGIDLPFFGSREEKTTVRVPSGYMYKIGGLRSKETRQTVRRIPFLGSIPILGALFRSTETSTLRLT